MLVLYGGEGGIVGWGSWDYTPVAIMADDNEMSNLSPEPGHLAAGRIGETAAAWGGAQ